MARLPRTVVPGLPQHVIQRGNNRQDVFFAESDHRLYLDSLQLAAERYNCAIHSYVLMTNHVHLLITPNGKESLSCLMQSVGRRYVRHINTTYHRTGTLWEGRFRSAVIDTDRYLLACMCYIELNPVRAGMIKSPNGYHWSSFKANAWGDAGELITPHPVYCALGKTGDERQMAYRALIQERLGEDVVGHIRRATQRGEVIGKERFRAQVASVLERRVTKFKHGGDRKSESFRKSRFQVL